MSAHRWPGRMFGRVGAAPHARGSLAALGLGMAVAIAGGVATRGAAVAEEAALPPAPYPLVPPPITWGQAFDLGHGYLVAAVTPGAVGFAIEAGFPWDELARCTTPAAVRDPGAGDPAAGVHRLTVKARAGALTVEADNPGTPPLLPGCTARAILAATFDSPATGTAEVAMAVVPRALVRGAPVVALVARREGAATERNAIAANALGAVDYCREHFGAEVGPKGGDAVDASVPRTGKVEMKLVTREDAVLTLEAIHTPFVGKKASACLVDATRPPVYSDPKARKETARVTVRLVAGGKLAVEAPERVAARVLEWARAVEVMRARGE